MLHRGGHVAFHHRLRLIVTDRAIAADDADDGTGHATLVRVAWPVVQVPFRALVSMIRPYLCSLFCQAYRRCWREVRGGRDWQHRMLERAWCGERGGQCVETFG